MQVNDELIKKLAELSRLEFSEMEMPRIREDLQKMIAFVEKLGELNLDEVEPLLHVSPASNVYREDEVEGQLPGNEALKNAPVHDGKFFKVPRVINKKPEQ